MSSFLRENKRIVPAAVLWICARWPSYLCSASIDGASAPAVAGGPSTKPILLSTSDTEVVGFASIGCVGVPARTVHSRTTPATPVASNAATSALVSGLRAYPARTASCAALISPLPAMHSRRPSRPSLPLARWMASAAASAGSTDASREMPTAMCGTKVRTSHLSSVRRAARSSRVRRPVFRFSAPAPLTSARESSAACTCPTESGGGSSSSLCRPPWSRSANAASPESRYAVCAWRYAARLAPVASSTAAVIIECVIVSGRAASSNSGRRRWPPAWESLAGASKYAIAITSGSGERSASADRKAFVRIRSLSSRLRVSASASSVAATWAYGSALR
mmetsp:Transcript_33256/g.77730  ORF Transcript_33256/g.77730 Transcript_33256/m.77730 type:complete len:336 (-) Transcript_33256:457-1464(-)